MLYSGYILILICIYIKELDLICFYTNIKLLKLQLTLTKKNESNKLILEIPLKWSNFQIILSNVNQISSCS